MDDIQQEIAHEHDVCTLKNNISRIINQYRESDFPRPRSLESNLEFLVPQLINQAFSDASISDDNESYLSSYQVPLAERYNMKCQNNPLNQHIGAAPGANQQPQQVAVQNANNNNNLLARINNN